VEILEAFCLELDRVVDIYEAQKAYFAMPELKRTRFTFRCSDIDCRREKNPLVSGVNYDKLAEESEKYRQIHFRAPKGNPHANACVWVREDGARQEPVGSDGEDRKPRLERAKKTNVIDIFRPKAFDANAEAPFPSPPTTANPPIEGRPREPGEPKEKSRVREGHSSTSSLERFINCWSQLDGDELKQTEVVIEGRALSYRQAVSRPNWIAPADNGTRILQGGARVKFWPEDAPKRLYINFMDDCDKFTEHEGKRTLTIDLPLSRIRAYSGGALLMEKIKQAQSQDHYLRVYCWGEIKARDQRPGYILDLASLDNLVLKAIPKKDEG
jgi:hypothetical protein